jgi:hypothetical protein
MKDILKEQRLALTKPRALGMLGALLIISVFLLSSNFLGRLDVFVLKGVGLPEGFSSERLGAFRFITSFFFALSLLAVESFYFYQRSDEKTALFLSGFPKWKIYLGFSFFLGILLALSFILSTALDYLICALFMPWASSAAERAAFSFLSWETFSDGLFISLPCIFVDFFLSYFVAFGFSSNQRAG